MARKTGHSGALTLSSLLTEERQDLGFAAGQVA